MRAWDHPLVSTWVYQLQDVDPDTIGAVETDMRVVDYTKDGKTLWTRDEVNRMRRSGGKVVAYLSIGEAEDYRAYWKPEWKTHKPAWLDKENPDWKGNFKVRFWDQDWQALVFGELKKIVDSGFDGAYLDIIDAYEYYVDRGRPDAFGEMVNFVLRISERVPKTFMVIPQNGEGLLANETYAKRISGIAIEDLHYGEDRDELPSKGRRKREAVLTEFHRLTGKPVWCVEYLKDNYLRQAAIVDLRRSRFIPYITTRDLDTLSEPAQ